MMPASNADRFGSSGGDGSHPLPLPDCDLSTDLACLVERVRQSNLPWVVVAGSALTAWQQRDPVGWQKVSVWLAAKGVAVVRI